jgi:hypothetical protein
MAKVDAYDPKIVGAERRKLRAIEGALAMADYRKDRLHTLNNLAKLRASRLEREIAVNKPIRDNARKGAVKKKSTKKFKGVRKEKKAA